MKKLMAGVSYDALMAAARRIGLEAVVMTDREKLPGNFEVTEGDGHWFVTIPGGLFRFDREPDDAAMWAALNVMADGAAHRDRIAVRGIDATMLLFSEQLRQRWDATHVA